MLLKVKKKQSYSIVFILLDKSFAKKYQPEIFVCRYSPNLHTWLNENAFWIFIREDMK